MLISRVFGASTSDSTQSEPNPTPAAVPDLSVFSTQSRSQAQPHTQPLTSSTYSLPQLAHQSARRCAVHVSPGSMLSASVHSGLSRLHQGPLVTSKFEAQVANRNRKSRAPTRAPQSTVSGRAPYAFTRIVQTRNDSVQHHPKIIRTTKAYHPSSGSQPPPCARLLDAHLAMSRLLSVAFAHIRHKFT